MKTSFTIKKTVTPKARMNGIAKTATELSIVSSGRLMCDMTLLMRKSPLLVAPGNSASLIECARKRKEDQADQSNYKK